MELHIRREEENDRRIVEELTREAFWNLHVPGCEEHYLVHTMRSHPDFIPELNYVAEQEGRIVGNIMYARSAIIDDKHNNCTVLTFGPVSVLPEFQRQGIGSALIRHTLDIAKTMNVPAVVITGHPKNYLRHGFKVSKDFDICDENGRFPYYLLAVELSPGILPKKSWRFELSGAYKYDPEGFNAFESTFPPKMKEITYSQYEFTITSRAFVD